MAARGQPGFQRKGGDGNHGADEGHAPDGVGVHHVLPGLTRRTAHDVALGGFKGQAEGERGGGRHVHPQNQHRRQRNDVPRQQRNHNQQPLRQVGRHDEQDGLLQVVVNATPLFHRAGDGGEVIVRQDHVRRLFGHFRALNAHRNTHVRLTQRRGIVHAVTGHADNFAFVLQRFHQAQLMLRAGTGEDVILHCRVRQGGIVHLLQLIAGDRLLAVADPQHLPDAHCRLRVIAGDHLHADPRLLAGVNRVNRFRARRIHHPGDAEEDQAVAQVIVRQFLLAVRRLERRGDHPQPLTRIALHLTFPVRAVEGFRTVAGLLLGAEGENDVRRAGDQNLLLTANLVVGAHVLVLRVERDFVNQRGRDRLKVGLRRQHLQRALGRPTGNAPQPALVLNQLTVVTQVDGAQVLLQHGARLDVDRLVAAFQIEVAHRLVAVAVHAVAGVGGDDGFDRHLVHGQGAGFIRADHGHRAKRFHRRQLADDGPLARHCLHAQGEDDGDNRRQTFRYGGDRQANQGEQQLAHRDLAERQAENKQRGHHRQNNRKDRLTQLVHLHQQRRTVLLDPRHHLVDVAEFRILTGGGDHADAAARADGRSGEDHVGAIAQR